MRPCRRGLHQCALLRPGWPSRGAILAERSRSCLAGPRRNAFLALLCSLKHSRARQVFAPMSRWAPELGAAAPAPRSSNRVRVFSSYTVVHRDDTISSSKFHFLLTLLGQLRCEIPNGPCKILWIATVSTYDRSKQLNGLSADG
jgi:hypothetical protein